MGLDRTIRFPSSETPSWEAIRAELARLGVSVSLRMIDGLPAFPDEIPQLGWNELRLGLPSGMVTIRRGPELFTCAIWEPEGAEQLQIGLDEGRSMPVLVQDRE